MNYRPDTKIGWCAGCGLYSMLQTIIDTLREIGKENAVIVSGIGCTARGAGYIHTDSIHTIHGRSIPFAVGAKLANPKLDVVVFSGDGDLMGIGGNHLLHAARRNDNITVICNNNQVFGMTGGQVAPTTPLGRKTTTTPEGSGLNPINAQGIITSNKKYFYARTSSMFPDHQKAVITKALQHEGFSFVEIISPCILNYPKSSGKTMAEVLQEVRKDYKVSTNETLGEFELGVMQR